MSVAHYTANSLSEFVAQICEIKAPLRKDGFRFNEIPLFRGHSDNSYQLIPAIARPIESFSSDTLIHEERNLIEMAKFKLPDVFREDIQPLELLALLQHYGVPTRLLDVTENALVALYFACCSKYNDNGSDGEVIIFKNNELEVANYPIINAIADSYRFAIAGQTFQDFYRNIMCQPYFAEQLHSKSPSIGSLENAATWLHRVFSEPHFVYAPIRSQRQRAQQGRYLVFSNFFISSPFNDSTGAPESNWIFREEIEPINKGNDSIILARITIPKDSKQKLLFDLENFGISKEVLFCDDIGTICDNITNSYRRKVRYVFNPDNC